MHNKGPSSKASDLHNKPATNFETEHRQEEPYEVTSDWLRIAEGAANAGFYDWDIHTEQITWSEGIYHLFGLPPDAKPSFATWLATVHPDDLEPALTRIHESIAKRISLNNEYRIILPDGHERWINALGNTFYDEAGKPLRHSGICIDITARKEMEEALRESEERFRVLVEASTQAVWETDAAGVVVKDSPSWRAYTGQTLDEWLRYGWVDAVHPDDREYAEGQWRQAVAEEKDVNAEFRLRSPDGGYRWTNVVSSPIRDRKGIIRKWIGMNIDITERKQAEEKLRKVHDELELRVRERTRELTQAYDRLIEETKEREELEEKLRQAHKMEAIGTLAGGIAHDFNNILAAIIGFTEMAIDDVQDRPLVEKNLQKVMTSATRARELVKQILAFSKKTSYERAPLALSPVVKETVKLLRASIPATIDVILSVTATSDTVIAAPVEVQQIVMNLATNALLAMQDQRGSLEIAVSDTDFEPDASALDTTSREYLQIMVKDTGAGMTPEVMKRVFEPFFTTREVGKGSGMGLAVVYGIVKDLGGTIAVESEPGAGSTFRVFLPKVRVEITVRMEQVQLPRGTERVLFVDDEPMLLEWGSETLERLGYRVTAAADGGQALRIFSVDPSLFDLVITDQAMPQMPGSDLCAELLRVRNDIPIILCTGHSETVSPEKAREIGIREFLMKPVNKAELASAVRLALDRDKGQ